MSQTISQALEAKIVLDTKVFMAEIKKVQRATAKTSSFATGAWAAVGVSIGAMVGKNKASLCLLSSKWVLHLNKRLLL